MLRFAMYLLYGFIHWKVVSSLHSDTYLILADVFPPLCTVSSSFLEAASFEKENLSSATCFLRSSVLLTFLVHLREFRYTQPKRNHDESTPSNQNEYFTSVPVHKEWVQNYFCNPGPCLWIGVQKL